MFIGSLWGIGDSTARTFAVSFYENFLQGIPLGESVRKARLQVREEFPGRPDWLAYIAYGHPEVICSAAPPPSSLDLLMLPKLEWNAQFSPPGALLRPEFGVVPFHGRESEIKDLLDWCHDSFPARVLLYTGAGGMGKTRLALEIAQKIRAEGWNAGFLQTMARHSPGETVEALLRLEGKTLVIVDYAETRLD